MSPDPDRLKLLGLESPLCDAALMARVTVEYIGRALDFDEADSLRLTREQANLLQFVVLETCTKIEHARAAFYKSLQD